MSQIGGFMVGSERDPAWRPILRWLLIALGVVIAAHVVPGISYNGPGSLGPHGFGTLALVVLLLSILNIVLRPLLILFGIVFVILTLGFGLLVINAFMFMLVADIVPGFHVEGFWAAFWGALVVSITSFCANRLIARKQKNGMGRILGGRSPRSPAARRDDDVIDV